MRWDAVSELVERDQGHGFSYISVEPFHLFRYLNERMFAYNERHRDDQGRFLAVLATVSGRRLTYAELTGKG